MYVVPLIDLQPEFDNPEAEAEIVEQIAQACESNGFLWFLDTESQNKLSNTVGRPVMNFSLFLKRKNRKLRCPLQDILW